MHPRAIRGGLFRDVQGARSRLLTHPIPDPPRTKHSYEFTDFGEQAFGAAYAAHACEETAAAKRRGSPSSRVDATGLSERLLPTRRSFTTAH